MRQALHVHSVLDDGKSTMEEMVLSAMERGLESIGFSGHSYLSFGEDWTMSQDNFKIYHAEIDRLKDEYLGRIKIYRGLEFDTFSDVPDRPYEYIIGSCHNINVDGEYISVDGDKGEVIEAIEKHFDGNGAAFAKAYFDELLNVSSQADILGHFDLCTKFNEENDLYTEEEYFDHALPVLRELNKRGLIFEVNTGAIQRGYRSLPYPSQRFLYELKKEDGRITITTDCHHASGIDFWYDEAVLYAKDAGFRDIYIFNGVEFKKESI